MICPAAPPSAATSKVSGSTWLDRLRSSRGFPPADGVDLDHFLAGQSSDSTAADPPRLSNLHSVDESRGVRHGRRLGEKKGEDVSDILCELFAMGGGGGGRGESSNCATNRRKSSRKQQNPRFWDATGSSKKSSNGGSSDDLRRRNNKKNNDVNLNCNNNGLASSGDNSLNQHRKERDSKDPGELGLDVDEEQPDLKGYSKSEVTVIDSSIQGWKVEMFVFRKMKSKSVWKVREKKSGSRSLVTARRKRKLAKSNSSDKDEDDDDDSGDGEERRNKKKKKKIVRDSDSPPGSLFKNGNRKEDAVLPLINEGQVRDDKVDQALKGVVGCLRGEAPVKSFPCSSSHRKSKSGASSVVLVKPISTFDKIGIKKPGKISINKGQQSLP